MSTGGMQPISYLRYVESTTLTGGTLESYVPAGSDWAEVKSVNQSFQNVAGQKVDGSQIRFKIRHRPSLAITDKWLIVYEGRKYKLLSLEPEKLGKDYWVAVGKAIN